jgi:hypothetical protein
MPLDETVYFDVRVRTPPLSRVLAASVLAALLAFSSGCSSTLSPDTVKERGAVMLDAELDGALAQEAAWTGAATTDERVAALWAIALDLEARRKFHLAAAAIARMTELDPTIASSDVVLVKLLDLHNQMIRYPLTVIRQPPQQERPAMIPLPR